MLGWDYRSRTSPSAPEIYLLLIPPGGHVHQVQLYAEACEATALPSSGEYQITRFYEIDYIFEWASEIQGVGYKGLGMTQMCE